ncbi:MAG: galactose-1-phosphate uridylyltransferase [Myxococcota bacterium]|nr:galactose-1-phosphate uridylyltransferase [Myxococcota bacterium]
MDRLPSVGSDVWEERWHPLREEWVVVAAHRQHRPWSGENVSTRPKAAPVYDPTCYLCPRNTRIGGKRNPDYGRTFVFDNDHPCVGVDAPTGLVAPPAPYRARRADGIARVVCFSPRHDATLATLPLDVVREVVETWRQQTRDLGQQPDVKHVLCFENKGEVVGVSNPHPHGQIYATNFVFKTIETELAAMIRHRDETGRGLFEDIVRAEQEDGRRILFEDDRVIAFVPYFARYTYEVYVAPKRRVAHVFDLTEEEAGSLAIALKEITVRFDNLWQMPFPYVMPLHQAPTDGGDYGAYHFFVAFHTPLRQPGLLKYLAGPEIGGGNFLTDSSPEAKAAELRRASPVHYLEGK